jgi:hypothetical protein
MKFFLMGSHLQSEKKREQQLQTAANADVAAERAAEKKHALSQRIEAAVVVAPPADAVARMRHYHGLVGLAF